MPAVVTPAADVQVLNPPSESTCIPLTLHVGLTESRAVEAGWRSPLKYLHHSGSMAVVAPTNRFISPEPPPNIQGTCRSSAATLYARRKSRSSTDLALNFPEFRGEVPGIFVPAAKTPGFDLPCSPRRLNLGFLPLPAIVDSPVCTPSSAPSSTPGSDSEKFPADSVEALTTAVSTTTPTWISTPPTPPLKSVRHPNGMVTTDGPASNYTPSASFPASTHPHARCGREVTLKKAVTPSSVRRNRASSAPPRLAPLSLPLSIPSRARSLTQDMESTFEGKQHQRSSSCGPIFHLANNIDNEDDASGSPESITRSLDEDSSPEGSWSDSMPEEVGDVERERQATRRYHALKELLSTELGYVTDLKAFITIYLRNLPTLARSPVFSRASSSFAAGPWVHSHPQINALANPSPTAPPESQPIQPSASSFKTNTRYLFTDCELELVLRNSEELLLLHEHFVKELATIVEAFDITMEHSDEPPPPASLVNLDAAIRTVSAKFATEASRFNAYQSFCAGHLEALDLVRKVSQQYPSEWEAFEQRCSVMVSDLEAGKVAESEPKHHSNHIQITEDRARALSLGSLDGAVRSLRMICPTGTGKDGAPVVVTPKPKREGTPPRRIALIDYMIKPIQRICKYPLLFDQLLTNKPSSNFRSSASSDVDVVVQSASQAMRHVASSVDEARHRQDAAVQSALIASRMFLGGQMLMAATEPTIQILTVEFLSSLGSCLLSGALDVMHHHPLRPIDSISSFKAKYLGAFLYPGGYLILVKVFKGRKYQPKHWFSLAEFTMEDVEEGEDMLPHSIRISCGEQHFELAASCQKEKDVWLRAMQDSVKAHPVWSNEPTPSYKFDEKGGLISSNSSEPELSLGLATIQSIPELSKNLSDNELSEPSFVSLRGPPTKNKMKMRRAEVTRPEISPSNSRRSSTASVKSIFGPTLDPETIIIRRSSPVARLHVDEALRDVISPACINARMYANTHDEELFCSTSNSIGPRNRTKSRLSKHESIRVPRSRTADSLDSLPSKTPSQKATIATRRNAMNLTITAIHRVENEKPTSSNPTRDATSLTPPTSAVSQKEIPQLICAETSDSPPSTGLLTPSSIASSHEAPRPPKTGFLVRGVRDLFHFRHSHPPSHGDFSSPIYMRGQEPVCQGSTVLHRWAIDSIRRRPRTSNVADGHRHPERTSGCAKTMATCDLL